MTADTNTDRRRWLALYVLCGSLLMIVLDATIVNVALPTIKTDLGFSQNSLAWVVNAYLIAFGGLLLLAGRLGDLIGERRIYLIGLAVFTAASCVCALSQSQGLLIGARFVQGAGGVLTDAINWHWIFFVNVPIGIATAFLAMRVVPGHEGLGLRQGADLPGAVLLTGGLMLGVYTILQVEKQGWGSSQTLALGAVSVALLAAFVLRQARIPNPLMPLRLFRSRNVVGANIIMALWAVGMFGMFFLGALYLQRILGYSPLEVGLAFLPVTIVMGTLSLRFSGPLNMRFGPRATLIPSLVCILGGLVLFARTPVDGSYWIDVLPVTVLLGIGAGLAAPALMTLAMSGATPSDSGLASGLINTTVQVGGALGLAVLATLASERTHGMLSDGASNAAALNSGYHLAYLVGAVLVAVALLAAVSIVRSPAAAAEPHAEPAPATLKPAYAEAA